MTAVNPPSFLEWCRECRDEREAAAPAVVIVWGKLFPPEALGPKCEEHAARHIPDFYTLQLGQWAVFDLRGLVREGA